MESQKQFVKQKQIFLLLSGFIFAIWWSGIFGSQVYWFPALFWLVFVVYLVAKNQFGEVLLNVLNDLAGWVEGKGEKAIIGFFIINGFFWVVYAVIKYYSFNYHTFDTGIYHNILFNLSNGEFFTSFHNVNFLGSHFNLNLFFVSFLYRIYPHPLWLVLVKIFTFLVSSLLIFQICKEVLQPKNMKYWAFLLISLWLFFYYPIISAVRFEFQGSNLALPFIFYAFLCLHRENWVRFSLTMIFLLGFKEHLGAIWIGFGCYLILATPRKKTGLFLIIMGILAIYIIMEQLMPWFREYAPTFRPEVNPFQDWNKKILYGIKLLIPFGFLPLFYWRYGIMVGPAIGINLISSSPTMYSSHYHYDDIGTCMLFIATILALRDLPFDKAANNFKKHRLFQVAAIFLILFTLEQLPYSNLRFIRKSIPEKKHFEIIKEIREIDNKVPDKRFAVQDVLGIHFNRREIQVFASGGENSCLEDNRSGPIDIIGKETHIDYIIMAKGVGTYSLDNFDQCLIDLRSSDQYEEIKGYRHLFVFKNL